MVTPVTDPFSICYLCCFAVVVYPAKEILGNCSQRVEAALLLL